jgi:hypothetical protein
MQKGKVAISGALLLILTACSNKEHYVIKADDGQLGSGTAITMTGDVGRIRADILPGFPNGLDEQVKVVERTDSPTGGTWKVETDRKLTLSFIVAAGAYICDSCNALGLPVTWHRDLTKK